MATDLLTTTQKGRDALVAAVPLGACPSCRASPLQVDKERYGWGSMGARYRCLNCGLQVRVPWSSLMRSGKHRARGGGRKLPTVERVMGELIVRTEEA